MNMDVYTSRGKLRRYAPKRFICVRCALHQNHTGFLKSDILTFHVCRDCGSPVNENPSYAEWLKAKYREDELKAQERREKLMAKVAARLKRG